MQLPQASGAFLISGSRDTPRLPDLPIGKGEIEFISEGEINLFDKLLIIKY